MAAIITYADDGSPELEIPDGEARRCDLYRDQGTSEVSASSYCLGDVLAEDPSSGAEVACNGSVLARTREGLRWELTPDGQERLRWEASLLKERWRAGPR